MSGRDSFSSSSTLHVRCGSDIRDALAAAGCAGDFLEFSDPYCQGPLRRDEFVRHRAEFISTHYGGEPAQVSARLGQQYAALARAPDDYAHIVLWFEHDSYDQLILARILHDFAAWQGRARIELICIDHFAGIDRFVGLGQLTPAQLGSLWPQRVAVGKAHFALGEAVWPALLASSPQALAAIAAAPTPAVAPMRAALRRHLMELPWLETGLGLTQQLTLRELAGDSTTRGALFARLQRAAEPLPFLGDSMFFAILETMAAATTPLIEWHTDHTVGERRARLTEHGAAVLAGELDWLHTGPPERWVGGIRVTDMHTLWRWSARHDTVVRVGQAVP